MEFVELPDREGSIQLSGFFHSVTEGLRLLKKDSAATAAAENGAINLWIDDNKKYRGERMRYCITEDTYIGTRKGLKLWLESAYKAIQ